MMSWWTILDAAGAPLCPCVEVVGADAPDPAIYGGVSVIALDGPIHPATAVWVDGAWTVDLSRRKAAMVAGACAKAEDVRQLYITPGAGQAMTYTAKAAEARAWTPTADLATFPFLSAEAASTGMDIADLVALVIGQADAWSMIGSAIEARRRALLVQIDAATSVAQLDAIDIDAGWSA